MGRQAKATCFSFMICRNNSAEKDGHTAPKVVKISDTKGRQTPSKTSFQELCNIVTSEIQSPDCNKASQEIDATSSAPTKDLSSLKNSLILEHTDELNRLEANCDTHAFKHSTVTHQLLSNCEAHSAKESVVEDPLANNDNCSIHSIKDALTVHKLEAVGISDDSLGKSDTRLVKNFLLKEECKEPTNAVESQAAEMNTQYDGEITAASDRNVQEYGSIFIQAAVKRFLAEKDLYKNNAAESQAVVRGHVVRTEAGESFHGIRGIHKIKTIFTSRHACQTTREGSEQDKLSKKLQVSASASNIKPKKVAHHLAKTDSSWRWLEGRLAHLTQSDMRQEQELTRSEIIREDNEPKNLTAYDTQDATLTADSSFTFYPNPFSNSTKPTEDEGLKSLTDYGGTGLHFPVTIADIDADTLESDDHKLVQHGKEVLCTNNYDMKNLRVGGCLDTSKMLLESDATEYDMLGIETELTKHTTERIFYVNSDTIKDQQFLESSRDESKSEITSIEMNIGNLPVQAKTESTSYVDQGSDSGSGSFQFHFSSSENITEAGLEYNPFSYNPYFENPYTDCSSSVSPMSYFKYEALDDFGKIPENDATKREGNDVVNSDADIASGMRDINSEVQNSCSHLYVRLEQCNELISLIDSLHVEQHLDESTTSSVYIKLENSKPSDTYSSTASSPRSHDGVSDSQMPSTQISVTTKLSKPECNVYTKSRTQSSHKCCQSIFENDPGGTEHLAKDIKSSKKQKSIGIPGPGHVDSNCNFTPSYMQTTESVRAKFNIDLKSTAVAHDSSAKKRPSLNTEHGNLNLSTGLQRSLQ